MPQDDAVPPSPVREPLALKILSAVCGFSLLMTPTILVVTLMELGPHHLALELRARHELAAVEEVDVTQRGRGDDDVHVTFTVDGEQVRVLAVGADPRDVQADGRRLSVAYLPDDPRRAMLPDDIPYYADTIMPAGFGLTICSAVVAAVSWMGIGAFNSPRRRQRAAQSPCR